MADLTGLGSQQEGNNFDDFEKLDPLASSGGSATDEFNVSSSNIPSNPLDEDLYTATPAMSTSEAQPAQPLLDFGEATKPVEPQFKAATTKPVEPKKEETPQKTGSTGSNWFKNIDPKASPLPDFVLDLIYWRDVKKSGVVFGSMMLMLLSLAMFSVLSVAAYLALAALTVTVSFRVYKNILGAVQKSGEGHPFKKYLEMDCALPADKVHQVADHISDHLSSNLRELRRLFLVEDLVDSIKFGLLLWVLTYIGAWFNGMTLIILGVIAIFTLPKFYEVNKEKIDELLGIAREHIKKVMSHIENAVRQMEDSRYRTRTRQRPYRVKEKIPIGKKEKTQ